MEVLSLSEWIRKLEINGINTYPSANVSKIKNNILEWVYRKTIPAKFLQQKNSETGTILYSSPELTAIDLVQYEQHIGGLSKAATVLAELTEQTDFSKITKEFLDITTISTIQRLGFILEKIIVGKYTLIPNWKLTYYD